MGSTTRDNLHRIAAHVLGRRRCAVSGHFGLRASPRGVATPAFGPEPEVLRIAGPVLVREVGTQSRAMPLAGATLAQLAAFGGADLDDGFSAGPDTPAVGPIDEPLRLSTAELDALFAWFDLGWRVLDAVTADSPAGRSAVQLWPEHFDAGCTLDLGADAGVNLGFSPGDSFSDEPYAYVGPWGPERPGDAAFWNAPFGAALPRSGAGGFAGCAAFIHHGLEFLGQA